MLNLFKQLKKQPEQISSVTKLLINKIYNYTFDNKVSLHTLHFFCTKEMGVITNATFKYCLNRALEYYGRDFNISSDKNSIYFKPKQLIIG